MDFCTQPEGRRRLSKRKAVVAHEEFFRLLRFGLPYSLQWLPGVLSAGRGGLARMPFGWRFFVPILGVVLKPSNPSSALPLFPFAPAAVAFDLHQLCSVCMHNAWTVVAFALVGVNHHQGPLRLCREPTW